MKRSHWIPIGVFSLLLIFVLVLQACNGKSPSAPGQITSYTPSNCTGIFGNSVTAASYTNSVIQISLYLNSYQPSSNQTLTKLSTYISVSAPITYELGIYSDYLGAPYTLISETGPQTIGPATMWASAPLSQTVALTNGKNYWLGAHDSYISYQAASGVTWAYQNSGITFGALPSTASATTTTGDIFSIYGTTCP